MACNASRFDGMRAVWRGAKQVALALALTAPALEPAARAADPPTGFIVVLRPGHGDDHANARRLVSSSRGQLGSVYEHSVHGFSIKTTAAEAAKLARDPSVAYIERDRVVTANAQSIGTGVSRTFAAANSAIRIDGVDDVRVDVDVAVIDTGIDLQHPDLNIGGGVNCTVTGPLSGCSAGGDDDGSHGTHVAGIIGALDNGVGVVGVAPGARLWAVKVLDGAGNGFLSSIIRGIDWVTANSATIDVVNLSLGTPGPSQALHDAIQAAVNNGVPFSVAAGNSHLNANIFVPGSFDNVITVSALADFDGAPGGTAAATCATDVDDTLASFSNWGAVDIVAPGVCINSTVPIEHGSYAVMNGTSMASPHVAGALALLARAHKPTNAQEVLTLYSQVVASGNSNWVDDSGDGVKEPLLDLHDTSTYSAVATPTCVVSSAGLLGWWRGDNGVTASVGPNLSGTVSFANAAVGSGMVFDGTHTLSADGFPTLSSAMTFEAWIKPIDTGKVQAIVSRWSFPGTDDSARTFSLMLFSGGEFVWSTDETSTRRPEDLTATAPQVFDGNFHHVAVTWDQTSIVIMIDGIVVASKPSQGGTLNPATTTQLRIGSTAGIGDPLLFTGVIDEPTIWGRVLTPAEINTIRNAAPAPQCQG